MIYFLIAPAVGCRICFDCFYPIWLGVPIPAFSGKSHA
jgi:hypothetical protein